MKGRGKRKVQGEVKKAGRVAAQGRVAGWHPSKAPPGCPPGKTVLLVRSEAEGTAIQTWRLNDVALDPERRRALISKGFRNVYLTEAWMEIQEKGGLQKEAKDSSWFWKRKSRESSLFTSCWGSYCEGITLVVRWLKSTGWTPVKEGTQRGDGRAGNAPGDHTLPLNSWKEGAKSLRDQWLWELNSGKL